MEKTMNGDGRHPGHRTLNKMQRFILSIVHQIQ